MTANISPLAQTFKVSDEFKIGCAITSVDLFLSAKDGKAPIEVQIVTTENGYPTNIRIDNAKCIMYPADVNVSANASIPTKFKFPVPVWLDTGKEYAIKIVTNSQVYKVWTSVIGERRVDNPAVIISQQPALGALYKSQNNSTWVADTLQDLTFVLNRAMFDIGTIGKIKLVEPEKMKYVVLSPNPFKLTNNSNKVLVSHPNHGMAAGMYVKYVDSIDTQFNGVTFTISTIRNSDLYVITTASNQTVTDRVGGGDVKTESGVKYDAVQVVNPPSPNFTTTRLSIKMSSGDMIDSTENNIGTLDVMDFGTTKYVHNSLNRVTKLAGASSLNLNVELSSIDNSISPVIDMNKLQFHMMSNKINSPVVADVDYVLDGDTIVDNALTAFDGSLSKITVVNTTDYSKIIVGTHIKVTAGGGAALNWIGYITAIDTTNHILSVAPTTTVLPTQTSILSTILQYKSFVNEIANNSSSESKHLTKQVNLANDCRGFRVIVQLNIPAECELQMYYRTGIKSPSIKLSDTTWTNAGITYKKSVNNSDFTEYEFNLVDLAKFNEFQFKFVMLSSTSHKTPRIKNLRIVAHG